MTELFCPSQLSAIATMSTVHSDCSLPGGPHEGIFCAKHPDSSAGSHSQAGMEVATHWVSRTKRTVRQFQPGQRLAK